MKKWKKASHPETVAWQQYEDGKNYNRRIGHYAAVRENERFYRGDQWKDVDSGGLPTPVFNLVGRIASYLTSSVLSYKMGVSYRCDSLPYLTDPALRGRAGDQLERLNRYAAAKMKEFMGGETLRDAVQDAVISGDGIFYAYWDDSIATGQPFRGDIRTATVDSVNLFVSDVTNSDLQSQEYLILAGRAPVEKLRREAIRHGCDEEILSRIVPDADVNEQAGDYSMMESSDPAAGKATFLLKFYRDEDGKVCFEKSVREAVIRRERTGMTRYPVAKFAWDRVKNSYHGASPLTQLIPNQKYVNKAYAMAMKHMADTAFSKVIYDKRLIPEWSNEVGEAIGVVSGGDIRTAAATIGVGEMQSDYLALIEQAIRQTKDLSGATDVALGQVDPTNTSAIIALREAAELPLDGVRASLGVCMGELAAIWLEMLVEYCGSRRLFGEDGIASVLDLELLSRLELRPVVDTGASGRYSRVTLLNTLDSLLKEGHITFAQYLERLPDGVLQDREALLSEIREKEVSAHGGEDPNGNPAGAL